MIKKDNAVLEKIFQSHLQCNNTQDILDYIRYKHLISHNYWKLTGCGSAAVFAYGDVLGKFDAMDARKAARRESKKFKGIGIESGHE